jgi:GlcNAc-P-P-Und epimerase
LRYDVDVIFGGAGFIAGHLTNLISARNFDIRNKGSDYCDVRIPITTSVKSDLKTVIYNLAAIHMTPGHEYAEYFDTNVRGAENVCDFARKNNINTIVFTSSIAPFGPSEDLMTENSLPIPNSAYGISKLIAEHIHMRWQAEQPKTRKLIILRPGVVFGKGEGGNFTRLYESLRKGWFFYPGRKDTLKACIYVKDLVMLMKEMVFREPPGVSLFNMCYKSPHSIEEIVYTMCGVVDLKVPSTSIPSSVLNIAAITIDTIAKITRIENYGINPERVKKLVLSTNISGEKLHNSRYNMYYTLEAAIGDWFADNAEIGLK